MPVTAKLSKQFYDKFGDELTNELVEWLNQVDATSQGLLKELNEMNFARFEAKLDQRIAELRAAMDGRFAEVRMGLARVEGGLIARIGLAEGRQSRLTLGLWIATIAAVATLMRR